MEPLRLGVLDLAPRLSGISAETALQEALLLARSAEDWGYHRYWVAEHHDIQGLACPSPEVLLGYVGALTSRIQLGSGALLLPHYSPLKVVESFHLLSALCPGRIELGLGRAPGGPPHASMALSGNFLKAVSELPETIRAVMELLQDGYAYEGQPVTARPLPAVSPLPWLLGTGVRSAEYAARFGTGYVFGSYMSDKEAEPVLEQYRRNFEPSLLVPEPCTMVAVAVICASSAEEAALLAEESRTEQGDRGAGSGEDKSRPPLLCGTPQQLREELQQMAHRCKTEDLLIFTPLKDYEKRRASYRLLAESVLSPGKTI
ncbi:luciferase [Bacillus sp. FJAT-27264]|uniref:MsnO8 family LLM class oxidoreductase n=1 Tax=Paenibacillus sp. (strain DSM 101736 / FJAT-27264) TaxID=1850362 RepID=UPI000807C124|nr:MsnO8 family LLM class oxidoreductase [Bacillus sp. FJAT-27264]OBZ08891.1 luciferase [Bacillus sp. FJAT-27264]